MNHTIHCRIHGLVQGVSFRYYTQKKAQDLDLIGWVRNCPDGTVEVFAAGPEAAIEQMKLFLSEGSPMARVDKVEPLSTTETNTVPDEFIIRR